jgi:hypothetical protein
LGLDFAAGEFYGHFSHELFTHGAVETFGTACGVGLVSTEVCWRVALGRSAFRLVLIRNRALGLSFTWHSSIENTTDLQISNK